MAIFHLSAQVIGRSAGRSAVAAAAYRAGEEIVDHRTGVVHDYTRKSGVDGAEIIAPVGAADWVFDRSELWNRVEASEKRKDSQLAREIEISIPRELPISARFALVREYARLNFADSGMVADVAFHHAGDLGHENPHAHIMLTMRDLKADGFGNKNRDWNDETLVEKWRENWADLANKYLADNYSTVKIDHRSFDRQGITDRLPTQHLGSAAADMERRDIKTERGDLNRQILEFNRLSQEISLENSEPNRPTRANADEPFSALSQTTMSGLPKLSSFEVLRPPRRETHRVLPSAESQAGRRSSSEVQRLPAQTQTPNPGPDRGLSLGQAKAEYASWREKIAALEVQQSLLKDKKFNRLPGAENLEQLRVSAIRAQTKEDAFNTYSSMPWYRKIVEKIRGREVLPPARPATVAAQAFGEALGEYRQRLEDARSLAKKAAESIFEREPRVDPQRLQFRSKTVVERAYTEASLMRRDSFSRWPEDRPAAAPAPRQQAPTPASRPESRPEDQDRNNHAPGM